METFMLPATINTSLYRSREKLGPFPEGALGKIKKGGLAENSCQLVKVVRYQNCSHGVLNQMCSEGNQAHGGSRRDAIVRQIMSDEFLRRYYPTRPIRELRHYLDNCPHGELKYEAILGIYEEYKTYFDFLREPNQTLYEVKTARVCASSGGFKLSGPVATVRQKLKDDPDCIAFIETDNDCTYFIADLDPNFREIFDNDCRELGLIHKYETGSVVSLQQDEPVSYYEESIEYWSDDRIRLNRRDGGYRYKAIVVDLVFISCSDDLDHLRQDPEEIILSPRLRSAASYGAGSLVTQEAYGRWYYRIRFDRSTLDPLRDRDIEDEYWVEERQISFAKPDYNAQVRDTIGVAMPKYRVGSYVTYASPVGRRLANTPFTDDYLLKLGIDQSEIFKAGLGVVVGHAQIYSERSFREMVWGATSWVSEDDEQLLPPWHELEEDLGWSYPPTFFKQAFWMFFNPETEFSYGGIPSRKRAKTMLMPIVCILHPETLNPAFLAYIPERAIKQTVSSDVIADLLEARKHEWAALDSVGISQQFEPIITGPILKRKTDIDFF
jgi:hypothetical protein